MQEVAQKHSDAAEAIRRPEVIKDLVKRTVDATKSGDKQAVALHVKALKALGVDQAEFDLIRKADAEKLPKKENSAAFDKAAYEADGGDAWTDPRRASFFEQAPVGADKALWAKAKQKASEANLPQWQAVLWIYRKLGGKHA
jgi:hypothetical protein